MLKKMLIISSVVLAVQHPCVYSELIPEHSNDCNYEGKHVVQRIHQHENDKHKDEDTQRELHTFKVCTIGKYIIYYKSASNVKDKVACYAFSDVNKKAFDVKAFADIQVEVDNGTVYSVTQKDQNGVNVRFLCDKKDFQSYFTLLCSECNKPIKSGVVEDNNNYRKVNGDKESSYMVESSSYSSSFVSSIGEGSDNNNSIKDKCPENIYVMLYGDLDGLESIVRLLVCDKAKTECMNSNCRLKKKINIDDVSNTNDYNANASIKKNKFKKKFKKIKKILKRLSKDKNFNIQEFKKGFAFGERLSQYLHDQSKACNSDCKDDQRCISDNDDCGDKILNAVSQFDGNNINVNDCLEEKGVIESEKDCVKELYEKICDKPSMKGVKVYTNQDPLNKIKIVKIVYPPQNEKISVDCLNDLKKVETLTQNSLHKLNVQDMQAFCDDDKKENENVNNCVCKTVYELPRECDYMSTNAILMYIRNLFKCDNLKDFICGVSLIDSNKIMIYSKGREAFVQILNSLKGNINEGILDSTLEKLNISAVAMYGNQHQFSIAELKRNISDILYAVFKRKSLLNEIVKLDGDCVDNQLKERECKGLDDKNTCCKEVRECDKEVKPDCCKDDVECKDLKCSSDCCKEMPCCDDKNCLTQENGSEESYCTDNDSNEAANGRCAHDDVSLKKDKNGDCDNVNVCENFVCNPSDKVTAFDDDFASRNGMPNLYEKLFANLFN